MNKSKPTEKPYSRISARVVMRNSYTRQDGTRLLYFQAFIDGARYKIPLDIACLPAHWHPDKMEVHSRDPEASDKNIMISRSLSRANEIAVRCRLQGEKLSVPQFARLFSKHEGQSFVDFWRDRMNESRPAMADGTYRHHQTVLAKFTAYCTDVTFQELDYEFVMGFDRYLRREYGNSHNTRAANMKKLRKWVNTAIAEGRLSRNPFEHITISEQQGHRIALTIPQVVDLVQLWQQGTLPDGRRKALQNFLLGCFTGLRISDVHAIRKEMVSGNKLIFTPRKTAAYSKRIEIPLTKVARHFIAKGGIHMGERISAAKTNVYLKEIAELHNLPRGLSFKAARHTFATMYLELGGKVHVLQRLLGHSNIRTTMIYVHISESRKEAEMGLFDAQDWGL